MAETEVSTKMHRHPEASYKRIFSSQNHRDHKILTGSSYFQADNWPNFLRATSNKQHATSNEQHATRNKQQATSNKQ
jgi:hypothetical protein